MKLSRKGVLLAVLQLAIVASLAAKYAIDRARFPRVWAQTVAYDPDLPIRGRYLSVRLRVDADRVYGASQLPKSIQGNFWATCGMFICTPRMDTWWQAQHSNRPG